MGMTLRARNDIHLARRIWHFSGVMFIAGLYWVLPQNKAQVAALSMSAILIGCDLARLRIARLNSFFTWLFRPVLRDSELHRISGITSMLAGVTLIVLVFPRTAVLLSLFFVAIADPLASYFGIRFGKDKLIGSKSLQGSMAAFFACFFISLVYFLALGLVPERLFIVCLLAGLVGAFSELLPVAGLDDNFVFPVMSAALLTGLLYVFGGL
jgi:diacylglycerol kinase (CTP)